MNAQQKVPEKIPGLNEAVDLRHSTDEINDNKRKRFT